MKCRVTKLKHIGSFCSNSCANVLEGRTPAYPNPMVKVCLVELFSLSTSHPLQETL